MIYFWCWKHGCKERPANKAAAALPNQLASCHVSANPLWDTTSASPGHCTAVHACTPTFRFGLEVLTPQSQIVSISPMTFEIPSNSPWIDLPTSPHPSFLHTPPALIYNPSFFVSFHFSHTQKSNRWPIALIFVIFVGIRWQKSRACDDCGPPSVYWQHAGLKWGLAGGISNSSWPQLNSFPGCFGASAIF